MELERLYDVERPDVAIADMACIVCGKQTIKTCYCCDAPLCPAHAFPRRKQHDSNGWYYDYYCAPCWEQHS